VLPVVLLHCLLGDGGVQFRLLEAQLHKQLVADYHARTSASSSSSTSYFSSSTVGAQSSSAHSSPRLVLDLYLPDLRNHGFSAHSSVHSYRALVADIRGFLESHGLRRPLLAGHSMGGKTALAYALSLGEEEVARGDDCVPRGLFILDAAPAAYTHEHTAIFAAMEHLSAATTPADGASGASASSSSFSAGSVPLLSTLRSKRDADVALRAVLPSPNDRAFVLTNLVDRTTLRATRQAMGQLQQQQAHSDNSNDTAGFDWRVNVSTLHRCERLVHGWSLPPPPSLSLSGVGPSCPTLATCFVGGGLSSRLTTPAYIEALPGYFPDREMHMIPKAAHFVHHSHAKECAHIMLQFIQKRIVPQLLTSEGEVQ
jgi:pimeloyl-ACP methyl ester carboxylesterase